MGALPFLSTGRAGGGSCAIGAGSASAGGPGVAGRRIGLVLEHDKTELFHFDRSHSNHNPPLDLGYAPYTGDRLLTPKTYWRYLGFYFDRKLLCTKRVRYYATKSFSTVQAMGMLGNSTRGLPPLEKRLLYRACVLPIALALVPMDHELSCQSLSSVTYLVGWHLWGSVAPNELMSRPGTVKLTLSG